MSAQLVFVLLFSFSNEPTAAQERYLFWIGMSDSTAILSNTIFGSTLGVDNVDTLVLADDLGPTDIVPRWFSHLAVDTLSQSIYWTDTGGTEPSGVDLIGAIRRASWSGDQPEVQLGGIVCGLGGPEDIALDLENDTVYWSERSDCFDALYRWDRSQSSWLRLPISGPYVVDGLDLDLLNGIMYWVSIDEPLYNDDPPPGIVRAPLHDTANDERIVEGCIGDIALALGLSKIYWVTCDGREIRRANLDGTNDEHILTSDGEISHIAIDHKDQTIYWTNTGAGKISRAQLDGTGTEDLLTGLIRPTSLALNFGSDTHLSLASPAVSDGDLVILRSVYPNPVRGQATMSFTVAEWTEIVLETYDALGRRIDIVGPKSFAPGSHEVQWHATGHASGVYFFRISARGQVDVGVITVQR